MSKSPPWQRPSAAPAPPQGPYGSAPARPLHLLRTRLVAPFPCRVAPGRWDPRHGLSCSSEPHYSPKSPTPPRLIMHHQAPPAASGKTKPPSSHSSRPASSRCRRRCAPRRDRTPGHNTPTSPRHRLHLRHRHRQRCIVPTRLAGEARQDYRVHRDDGSLPERGEHQGRRARCGARGDTGGHHHALGP